MKLRHCISITTFFIETCYLSTFKRWHSTAIAAFSIETCHLSPITYDDTRSFHRLHWNINFKTFELWHYRMVSAFPWKHAASWVLTFQHWRYNIVSPFSLKHAISWHSSFDITGSFQRSTYRLSTFQRRHTSWIGSTDIDSCCFSKQSIADFWCTGDIGSSAVCSV